MSASGRTGEATAAGGGRTRTLLAAGAVAGPLFLGVVLAQMALRPGFDLARHPISLLGVGDLGWVQVANFVVAGALAFAFAVGLSRVLRGGRGGTWGPRLMGVFGLGLIAGGVFTADPALGFPPGTPDGIPSQLSWHATVHAIAPPLAFTALIVATFVLARRFAGDGERGWAAYSVASGLVALLLVAWPSADGMSWRLALAMVPAWAWVAALALRLRSEARLASAEPAARDGLAAA